MLSVRTNEFAVNKTNSQGPAIFSCCLGYRTLPQKLYVVSKQALEWLTGRLIFRIAGIWREVKWIRLNEPLWII